MARDKATADPPPPVSHYKEEYGWASDGLLAECSTLNSITDVEAHTGDPRFTISMLSTKPTIPTS